VRTPLSESAGTLFAKCLSKSGTSEGAKKAWEVRRRAKEEAPKDRPVKSPKVVATLDEARRLVSERIAGVPLSPEEERLPRYHKNRVMLSKHFAKLEEKAGPTPAEFTQINPVVDTVVKNLGEACAEITRKTGKELGFIVENATGSLVGNVVEGNMRSVDFSPLIPSLDPNKGYTHFHTHPGGSTFSSMDLAAISAVPQLTRGVVYGVVKERAEVYEIAKPIGFKPVDPDYVKAFASRRYYEALGGELVGAPGIMIFPVDPANISAEEKSKAKEVSVRAAASKFGLNYKSSENPAEQKA